MKINFKLKNWLNYEQYGMSQVKSECIVSSDWDYIVASTQTLTIIFSISANNIFWPRLTFSVLLFSSLKFALVVERVEILSTWHEAVVFLVLCYYYNVLSSTVDHRLSWRMRRKWRVLRVFQSWLGILPKYV